MTDSTDDTPSSNRVPDGVVHATLRAAVQWKYKRADPLVTEMFKACHTSDLTVLNDEERHSQTRAAHFAHLFNEDAKAAAQSIGKTVTPLTTERFCEEVHYSLKEAQADAKNAPPRATYRPLGSSPRR